MSRHLFALSAVLTLLAGGAAAGDEAPTWAVIEVRLDEDAPGWIAMRDAVPDPYVRVLFNDQVVHDGQGNAAEDAWSVRTMARGRWTQAGRWVVEVRDQGTADPLWTFAIEEEPLIGKEGVRSIVANQVGASSWLASTVTIRAASEAEVRRLVRAASTSMPVGLEVEVRIDLESPAWRAGNDQGDTHRPNLCLELFEGGRLQFRSDDSGRGGCAVLRVRTEGPYTRPAQWGLAVFDAAGSGKRRLFAFQSDELEPLVPGATPRSAQLRRMERAGQTWRAHSSPSPYLWEWTRPIESEDWGATVLILRRMRAPEARPKTSPQDPARAESRAPLSVLYVLDRSSSMQGLKLRLAVAGALRSADALAPDDRIGLISFAEDATLDLPMTPVSRIDEAGRALGSLRASGNTDLYRALLLAREVLAREDSQVRHLLVLTDGRQTGREMAFVNLVKPMAREGISLTAVGLGPDHDERLLKNLAAWARRGSYRPVHRPGYLPAALTQSIRAVSRRARKAPTTSPKARGDLPEGPGKTGAGAR